MTRPTAMAHHMASRPGANGVVPRTRMDQSELTGPLPPAADDQDQPGPEPALVLEPGHQPVLGKDSPPGRHDGLIDRIGPVVSDSNRANPGSVPSVIVCGAWRPVRRDASRARRQGSAHPGRSGNRLPTEPHGQVTEFKSMVKALHAAGIKVILDIVTTTRPSGASVVRRSALCGRQP